MVISHVQVLLKETRNRETMKRSSKGGVDSSVERLRSFTPLDPPEESTVASWTDMDPPATWEGRPAVPSIAHHADRLMEMAQAEQPRREPGSCLQLQDHYWYQFTGATITNRKNFNFFKKNEVNPQILVYMS
jgi:hypothetical protein